MFPFTSWLGAQQYALSVSSALFGLVWNEHRLPECRVMPGDESWPGISAWDAFNASVDGRLIKTVPIGSVCHHPNYDEAKCEDLRKSWRKPHTQYVPYQIAGILVLTPFTARGMPPRLWTLSSWTRVAILGLHRKFHVPSAITSSTLSTYPSRSTSKRHSLSQKPTT